MVLLLVTLAKPMPSDRSELQLGLGPLPWDHGLGWSSVRVFGEAKVSWAGAEDSPLDERLVTGWIVPAAPNTLSFLISLAIPIFRAEHAIAKAYSLAPKCLLQDGERVLGNELLKDRITGGMPKQNLDRASASKHVQMCLWKTA